MTKSANQETKKEISHAPMACETNYIVVDS